MNLQRYLPALVLFLPSISVKYLFLTGYFLWPILTQVQRHALYATRGVCSVDLFRDTVACRFLAPFTHTIDSANRYVTTIQTEFNGLEGLLSSSTEVLPLVQSLTEAHLSIDHLTMVVKSSTLSSRVALVAELAAMTTETKEVIRGLQKLFAQVQGTIDVMLAVNENLLRLLHHRISPTSLLAVYCHAVGNSFRSNDCAASNLRIAQAFNQTIFQFQQALSALIRRVVQVQGSLDGIEIRLEVIRDLVAMENGVLIPERSDVLTGLLASLGLHRQQVARLDLQLKSLQDVARYRALTTRYVSSTTSGLSELEEALEVLRSLALGAGLIDGVSMDIIIDAFTKGVVRLHGQIQDVRHSNSHPASATLAAP